MSNIEDIRKVNQDFVAPDWKALAARIESLETEINMRFDHVDTRLTTRKESTRSDSPRRRSSPLRVAKQSW